MTAPDPTPSPDEAPAPHTPRLFVFGCGYVGMAVVCAARVRGWSVGALTRNVDRAAELRRLGVDVVVGDLAAEDWHGRIAGGQDFVLNCVSAGGGGLPGYWRSYVDGTRSILAWAARAGAAQATFVYTGSTGVYPQGAGEVVTEDSPVGGGGSETAAPLLEAERLVRESCCFRRSFILRLAGIYGPGRHYLLDQLRAGATLFPGTGVHRLNLVHRDDIVTAVTACFDAPLKVPGGIFNVADDQPSTKHEVVAWLAGRVGCAMPAFSRDAQSLLPGTPIVRGRSGPVPDRIIANARIKNVLGWRPRHPDFRGGYEQIFAAESPGAGS